jgi:hypothetical protein
MSSSGTWASAVPQRVLVPKPHGILRILGLADSYGVAGRGGNFHYLAEDILRREVSPQIQMVNVSVAGNQLPHELALLRFAVSYSPDLIVHSFYVGNDFWLTDADMYIYGSIWLLRTSGTPHYRPRNFLLREFLQHYRQLLQDRRRKRDEAMDGVVAGTFSQHSFLKGDLRRLGRHSLRGKKGSSSICHGHSPRSDPGG